MRQINKKYILFKHNNEIKKKIYKNSVDKNRSRDYNTDIRKDGHDPVHYIDFEIIVFSIGIMKEEVRPPED